MVAQHFKEGKWKKKGKKRLEQRKSLLALGFNSDISGSWFNYAFLHELGETKAQALQKLQVSSLNLYNLRNLHFCSHVVLPLVKKNKAKRKKQQKEKQAMFLHKLPLSFTNAFIFLSRETHVLLSALLACPHIPHICKHPPASATGKLGAPPRA